MVGSLILPIIHGITNFTNISLGGTENFLLKAVMYSVMVGAPIGLFNYFSDFDFKSAKNTFTSSNSKEKVGCSSCKKKKK